MTPTTEDYRAAEVEPMSRAVPLTYATPAREPRSAGVCPLLLLTAFILIAGVGIFAIITDHHLSGDALWAGAVAVVALAGMGTAMGHFLTRAR